MHSPARETYLDDPELAYGYKVTKENLEGTAVDSFPDVPSVVLCRRYFELRYDSVWSIHSQASQFRPTPSA